MTYREHRRACDRAYFAELLERKTRVEAIRLSGLHKATFYKKLKTLRLTDDVGDFGNGAWQGLGH